MKRFPATIVLAMLAGHAMGCGKCLSQGNNGVADPDPDEYQLVFSNIVAQDTELIIDNLGDEFEPVTCWLCAETEYITVGNFPVSTQTTIEMHTELTEKKCFASTPCCDSNCNAQICHGSPVIDTTPFGGAIFATGLIWRLD